MIGVYKMHRVFKKYLDNKEDVIKYGGVKPSDFHQDYLDVEYLINPQHKPSSAPSFFTKEKTLDEVVLEVGAIALGAIFFVYAFPIMTMTLSAGGILGYAIYSDWQNTKVDKFEALISDEAIEVYKSGKASYQDYKKFASENSYPAVKAKITADLADPVSNDGFETAEIGQELHVPMEYEICEIE